MDAEQHFIDGHVDETVSFTIPPVPLIAIEHPFIVHDLPKAIRSLGGDRYVQELIREDEKRKPAILSLRPEDQFSRTVEACAIRGTNAVLQIKVPKWTGRKRKRGSDEPFAEEAIPQLTKEDQALRALRDNHGRKTVAAVGQVVRTHRFRDPPDFVWAASTNRFLDQFRNTLLSQSYEKMSEFRLDPDNRAFELVPPPVIAPTAVPWAYSYRQSTSIKTIEVGGQKRTFNTSLQERRSIVNVRCDEPNVPDPPQGELEEAFKTLSPYEQTLVSQLQRHFDVRPIWTRRSLINTLRAGGMHQQQMEHHVYAQVAYTFGSGPWRDTVVRYGVDPRKDPKLRIYQTMAFRTDDVAPDRIAEHFGIGISSTTATQGQGEVNESRPEPRVSLLGQNHVFDGQSIDISGKLWQMCDVTDPTVKTLLESAETRETCDVKSSGWYYNGTWAKVRAILKAKIRHLLETGKPLDDSRSKHIRHIMRIPDIINNDNLNETLAEQAPQSRDLAKLTEAIGTRVRGPLGGNAGSKAISKSSDPVDPALVVPDQSTLPNKDVNDDREGHLNDIDELLRDVRRGAEEGGGETGD